jgi:hypothetical protein
MPQRITAALTRRRLGGAVLLLAGLVIAVFVLWPNGGDDPPKVKPLPVRIVSVPPLGLGFVHPRTWKRVVRGDVIRLTSPDRTLVLLFSSPFNRPNVGFVKHEAKVALLKRFSPAKVVHEGPSRLGRQDAESFEITGERGVKLVRALVQVGSSRWRTYVVTMLTGENPSRRTLTQARRILATVSFSKPRKI